MPNFYDRDRDDDSPPDNRGKASSAAWTEPSVSEAEVDRAIGEALGTGRAATALGCSRHGHHHCTACAEAARVENLEKDLAHYRRRAHEAEAKLRAYGVVDRNLDALWALLITDYSGDLENKAPPPGWTRDRETMLLRAARGLREARKGGLLVDFLSAAGNLYRE